MEEIWKDVVGFEGKYKVSNRGNLISNARGTGWKPLKPTRHHSGYMLVRLASNRTYKNLNVHRIVADAFIPNPEGKKTVNHIDGNKSNNTVENLEWATQKENINHAIDTGLNLHDGFKGRTGILHPQAKAVLQYDKNGNFIKRWDCISDASRFYGLSMGTISCSMLKENGSAAGFIWKRE